MPLTPKNTTRYHKEPKHDRYEIGFAPELIPFILAGKKIRTYRFRGKYNYLEVGDEVTVLETVNRINHGKAIVIGKKFVTFSDLPLEELGHESYINKEHQRRVFSSYYAYLGRPIADSDPFLIIEFKLI